MAIDARLFLPVLALLSAGCAGTAKNDARQETESIRATLADAIGAFNRGDVDTYMNLHAEDAMVLAPDRRAEVGKQAILAATKELFDNYSVRENRTIDEIFVSGGLAFVRGSYDSVVAPRKGGPAAHDVGKYIEILVKQEPGWKYKRSIWNSDGQRPPG